MQFHKYQCLKCTKLIRLESIVKHDLVCEHVMISVKANSLKTQEACTNVLYDRVAVDFVSESSIRHHASDPQT